jgi:hypothetical protein
VSFFFFLAILFFPVTLSVEAALQKKKKKCATGADRSPTENQSGDQRVGESDGQRIRHFFFPKKRALDTTETCLWRRLYAATVADCRHTYGDRKIQSAIDRRHGHIYVVRGADCTATVGTRTAIGQSWEVPLQKHVCGTDRTATARQSCSNR